MSVINNVLKDLEGRNSGFTPIEVSAVDSHKKSSAGRTPWAVWTVVLVILSVTVAGYLQMNGYLDRALPVKAQQPAFQVVPPATAAIPEVPPPPVDITPATIEVEPLPEVNEIIGLQLRESESDLVLEFALKERVISYLKERSENRFVYHISDVNSLIVAPLLQDNPWLRQLALQSIDDGVDIRFTTTDNLMVETAQSSAGDEWIWSITFRKANPRRAQALASRAVEPGSAPQVAETERAVPVEETTPALEVEQPLVTPVTVAKTEPQPLVNIRSSSQSASDDNKLIQASRLIKAGQLSEAQSVLQTLLDGEDDLRARRLLHGVYSRSGNRGAYQALLRESMQRYPAEAEFVSRYAGLLFRDRDYVAVIDFFAQRAPLEVGHHSLLAMSYQREGLYDDAVTQFKQALKLDGRDSKNWAGLAISLEQLGDHGNALKAYQQARSIGGLSRRLSQFVGERIAALQQVVN